MDLSSLLESYRAPLVGLIAAWGAPWADAVELAEDSFAEAWLKRASCRGDWRESAVFGAWLRGVARNFYRNWSRSNRRRRLRIVLSEEVVRAAEAADAADADEHAPLRAAVDRLPRKQRQVVLMHYLDETRVADVAILLGLTTKAVEGRLYQARRSLRRLLGATPAGTEIRSMLLCL